MAVIQNTTPRSIIKPLQLWLAVILYCHFEFRYLINISHRFGLYVSYSEVLNFKLCAADQLDIDLYDIDNDLFLYFVADNMDQNSDDTINRLYTFHGIGITA